MDRFTLGVVASAVLLAIVAFAMIVSQRVPDAVPDLGTADGTVRAYIAAVRDRRADDAWRLLEGPGALEPAGGPFGNRMTEAEFQRRVNSLPRPSNRRLRILPPRQTGDTTTVEVEIVSTSDAPFFFNSGSSARQVAFSLRQIEGQWRITAAPPIWEIG